MLRKRVITKPSRAPSPIEGSIPIEDIAVVEVTSEQPHHPIDHAFDSSRGPGATRWVADVPGTQLVTLVFDRPQTIRQIGIEVEETEVGRTQELSVAASSDDGRTYRELIRQEFHFSPPGTTFERESWSVSAGAVTHLQLEIKPDKGGEIGRATLTSVTLA
jgi:hypothetical protein